MLPRAAAAAAANEAEPAETTTAAKTIADSRISRNIWHTDRDVTGPASACQLDNTEMIRDYTGNVVYQQTNHCKRACVLNRQTKRRIEHVFHVAPSVSLSCLCLVKFEVASKKLISEICSLNEGLQLHCIKCDSGSQSVMWFVCDVGK